MTGSAQRDLDRPLAEADWERLETILEALGERATLGIEGLDGLIAAFACGPRGLMPSRLIPLAFAGEEMPEFAREEDLRDFVSLFLRRGNEYSRFLALAAHGWSAETVVAPMLLLPEEEEAARAREWSPGRGAEPDGRRPGRWIGQAWARGFMRAWRAYPELWNSLDDFEDGMLTLAPLMMLDVGFNPDRPDEGFDPERWVGLLPLVVRDLDAHFRAEFVHQARRTGPHRAAPSPRPQRSLPLRQRPQVQALLRRRRIGAGILNADVTPRPDRAHGESGHR